MTRVINCRCKRLKRY